MTAGANSKKPFARSIVSSVRAPNGQIRVSWISGFSPSVALKRGSSLFVISTYERVGSVAQRIPIISAVTFREAPFLDARPTGTQQLRRVSTSGIIYGVRRETRSESR